MLQICIYICAFNVLHIWSCRASIHYANTLVLHSGSLSFLFCVHKCDRLCGLVVMQRSWVRFPGTTRFFREVVGLERGPLSLVSTTEELLGRKSSGSCLENRDYGHGDPLHWPRNALCLQNVATNFTEKRLSLGRYSSLTDWGHRLHKCILYWRWRAEHLYIWSYYIALNATWAYK
jgi:hypothetical protein